MRRIVGRGMGSIDELRSACRSRVAISMLPPYSVVEARTTSQFEAARTLIQEYAASVGTLLGVDLTFQNIEAELNQLQAMYGPPVGCLLLAGGGEDWVGCAALRRFSDGVCEMKRLYIKPSARGANLGRHLAENLVCRARLLGYRRMVLDTLGDMTAARSLYHSLGFRETDPYYFNPMEGVSYMELYLGTEGSTVPHS